jgi:dinuclear metal center YbgI/SA1388 family protein
MHLNELSKFLDELLPSTGLTDHCPNGLQVEGKSQVLKIATAVSASLSTIEAAVEQNVDVLIVHHGLFWQRDSYVIQGVKKKKLSLLMEHEISLFGYHLPLDIHHSLGNNWKAAIDLGWRDLQPFGYINGVHIGVRGQIDLCSSEELRKKIESYYQHPATCTWGAHRPIQNVALVSGSGYRLIGEAAANGIDAFITGSYDEPAWHQALEEGIDFFALGHSATERIGPIALAEYLNLQFPVPTHFIEIENPF